jgi:hypothetical protein
MEREDLTRILAAGYCLRSTAQALSRATITRSRELARLGTAPVTYRAVPDHKRTQRWSPWVARFSLVLTLATLFAAVSLVRTKGLHKKTAGRAINSPHDPRREFITLRCESYSAAADLTRCLHHQKFTLHVGVNITPEWNLDRIGTPGRGIYGGLLFEVQGHSLSRVEVE